MHTTFTPGPTNIERFTVQIHFPLNYTEEEKQALIAVARRRITNVIKDLHSQILVNRPTG